MKVFKVLYGIWAGFWLLIWFLVCYPLMFVGALHPKLHWLTHFMNRVWGVLVFGTDLLFVKKEQKIKHKGPAVYCVNHTSYIDIPLLFLTVPGFFMIIGKAELNKAPLFGFYFSRVYISVDRRNSQSRYDSFQKCLSSIDKGRSVVFFPEGTIPSKGAPQMTKFKDGAFRTAIEKQVPVIPVTFPNNWIILPGSGNSPWPTLKRPVAIFHDPISTEGMTLENDLASLSKNTFDIIDKEIKKHNA